jgi:hypothetical protein
MVPLFFYDPPPDFTKKPLWTVTFEFRQAMLKRLTNMATNDFHAFARWVLQHKVIARFKDARRVAPTRDLGIVDVPLVPEIWDLARLIVEKNVYKVWEPGNEPRILLRPPRDEEELWDEVTRIICENLTVIDQISDPQ